MYLRQLVLPCFVGEKKTRTNPCLLCIPVGAFLFQVGNDETVDIRVVAPLCLCLGYVMI